MYIAVDVKYFKLTCWFKHSCISCYIQSLFYRKNHFLRKVTGKNWALYKIWIFNIRHETKLRLLNKVSHCSNMHPVIQRVFQTCIQTSKLLCQLILHLFGQSLGHLGECLVRQRNRQHASGSHSHSTIWLIGEPNRKQGTGSHSHSPI